MKIKLVIFASGNGTNAENIVKYFKNHNCINIKACFVNNKNAFVLKRMEFLNIPTYIFNKEEMENGTLLKKLIELNTNFIILAGFLWLLPEGIVNFYEKRILNIHPSLLPKYGGKGFYGNKVIKEILNNKESYTGITIHLVNKEYDKGEIIFQKSIKVYQNDDENSLYKKIHNLEHTYYPKIIEWYVNYFSNKVSFKNNFNFYHQ